MIPPILWRFLPYVAAIVAALGVFFYVEHLGAVKEREAIAAKAAKDKANAKTEREKLERDTGRASDRELIDGLRNPD